MQTVKLTRQDDGKSVYVHPGDLISVRLDESASTGYRWEVDRVDNSVLLIQKADLPVGPIPGIGETGKVEFSFTVQRIGKTRLQLKLLRPWEGDSSVIDRFNVAVEAT